MIRKYVKAAFIAVIASGAISWLLLMYWISWRMLDIGYIE